MKLTPPHPGHTLGVVSLAVASNGLVASSALDSFVRVWDLKTHETRCVIECPAAENWAVAFEARSCLHWFPYDPVGVMNAVP